MDFEILEQLFLILFDIILNQIVWIFLAGYNLQSKLSGGSGLGYRGIWLPAKDYQKVGTNTTYGQVKFMLFEAFAASWTCQA